MILAGISAGIPVGAAATSLLKGLLGAGGSPSTKTQASAGEGTFASMLAKAKSGELSSGLPVVVAPGAGVQLSGEQLTKLASAADVAEASGASKALVAIDGRMLTMDVATREITADVTAQLASHTQGVPAVLADIEAFVQVPSIASTQGGGLAQGAKGGALQPHAMSAPANASLLHVLAQHDRMGAAQGAFVA